MIFFIIIIVHNFIDIMILKFFFLKTLIVLAMLAKICFFLFCLF